MTSKITSKLSHARGRLTPPRIRRKYPERVEIAEKPCQVCKKKKRTLIAFLLSLIDMVPEVDCIILVILL